MTFYRARYRRAVAILLLPLLALMPELRLVQCASMSLPESATLLAGAGVASDVIHDAAQDVVHEKAGDSNDERNTTRSHHHHQSDRPDDNALDISCCQTMACCTLSSALPSPCCTYFAKDTDSRLSSAVVVSRRHISDSLWRQPPANAPPRYS